MKVHIIPVLLIAALLCSCYGESKACGPWSSSPPAQTSVSPSSAGQPTSEDNKETRGEYVSFPACGISIRHPEGFEKAKSFEGFEQPEIQASVMAVRIPGPYSKVIAGFTREHMKARGWTLHSREEVKVDGVAGILVHFEQPAGGQVFLKWSLSFGDQQQTTMVTATFPKTRERELSARLKSAVLSTRPERAPGRDPAADLPFTIAASEKLRLTAGLSKTLAYTKDGVIPTRSPKDPLFIAAPALGKVIAADKRQFAERRLYQTAHTKRLMVESTVPITIDGLHGYESLAEGEDAQSGTPLVIYQVILFDNDSYILMQGLVGTDLRDEYLPEFKAIARSLKKK